MHLAFGDCILDLDRRELRRNGETVHTRAKVFDILCYLIANRDRVLHRDELLTHGWPGLTVSDTTLSTCILSVRRAIGDDAGDQRFIKTLRGQGFRFVAEVTSDQEAPPPTASSKISHARDDRLSIAVLPFANLNRDPSLDYLADGLAEDILTALSHFKAFTVIARNSSFLYRGLANDIKKIGVELQVDYVLEGSVRCVGERFRATAQLIHVPTMKHVWAENYDGEIGNLLTLQDDISQTIVINIAPQIDLEEIRQAFSQNSSDLKAQEIAWQARALLDRARSEGNPALYADCIAKAEEAIAVDPNCRQAWWVISVVNIVIAFARQGDNPDAPLARARQAAEKLRALDPNDHAAYMAFGWIGYIERDLVRAKTNLDHAHSLNPNCTMTLMFMGVVETSVGRAEEGYAHLNRAMRLSPRDIWLGFMNAAQGLTCYALAKYDEGAKLCRQAIDREPYAPANHIILAACLAELGNLEAAAAAIQTQRKINDAFLQEYLDRKRLPFQVPAIAERYAVALHRANDAAA